MLGLNTSLCFNAISQIDSFNVQFTFWGGNLSNLAYCDFCNYSHDLFGCVCLNHQEFCILNKKYSESEYKSLREKIIEHMKKTSEWGQFFPAKMSCFGYNETTANLYFPLSREEALRMGFKWKDKEEKPATPQTYEISDDIKDLKADIINATLQCASCKKNYKIVEQEFKWLKDHSVPISGVCHDCRLLKRANLRNPRKLWMRECAKCKKQIQTTYAPDRPEKVYCEKCYLEAVY